MNGSGSFVESFLGGEGAASGPEPFREDDACELLTWNDEDTEVIQRGEEVESFVVQEIIAQDHVHPQLFHQRRQ